ncbi:unnamed protein product [Lactuca saligna]|uniref:Uncharacterized protein n=1 Tax=Lactuca saligna TaxID=75948 RepID=A0AA36DUZ8_LACSI|nr:unnamed protein product [Lactuca saligna]
MDMTEIGGCLKGEMLDNIIQSRHMRVGEFEVMFLGILGQRLNCDKETEGACYNFNPNEEQNQSLIKKHEIEHFALDFPLQNAEIKTCIWLQDKRLLIEFQRSTILEQCTCLLLDVYQMEQTETPQILDFQGLTSWNFKHLI